MTERLRSLPQLAKASATLAIAARALLEFAEPGNRRPVRFWIRRWRGRGCRRW